MDGHNELRVPVRITQVVHLIRLHMIYGKPELKELVFERIIGTRWSSGVTVIMQLAEELNDASS